MVVASSQAGGRGQQGSAQNWGTRPLQLSPHLKSSAGGEPRLCPSSGREKTRSESIYIPKCQQISPPSEGESGIHVTVPATSAMLEGCK